MATNVLDFDLDTKTYALSAGAISLANSAILTGGVAGEIQRRMEEIAHRHGITVGLWRRVGDDRVLLVWLVESPTPVRIMLKLGQRLPLLIGASGRVVCAFSKLPMDEVKTRFASLRWHSGLSLEQYLFEVGQAAEKGYAIDNGIFVRGALGIAAPIFERDASVRSVVSSTSFVGQHDSAEVLRIAEDIKQLGADLTRLLTDP